MLDLLAEVDLVDVQVSKLWHRWFWDRFELETGSQLRFSEAFGAVPQLPHRIFSGDPGPKSATLELTAGFQEQKRYFNSSRPQAAEFRNQWISKIRSSDIDESEDDEEYEEDSSSDDDDDNDENESNLKKTVTLAEICDSNLNERYDSAGNSQNMKDHSSGIKEGYVARNGDEINKENNSSCELSNARGRELYYPRFLNGAVPSSSSNQKDIVVMENGCGFSGRKDASDLSGSGECLGAIFSDPTTNPPKARGC